MPRALKVFRTAVGFRDAYVAAPSKAAALRAWGTEKDLFARGAAELVTDPTLTAEALSKPGEVVYRTRGGLEAQVAALGPLPSRVPDDRKEAAKPRSNKASPHPKPRPSRAALDSVRTAIATLREEQEQAEAALHRREQALAAERKQSEDCFAKRLKDLEHKEKRARDAYEAALRKWQP